MKPLALLGALLVLALSWKGGLAQTLSPFTCAAAVDGCTACTDRSLGCDLCRVGYVKDGTSCKSCGSGCNNCTVTNGTVSCNKCNSAYFLATGQCSTCLQNCNVCKDKASCTTCENGFRQLTTGQPCELCETSCKVCDGPTKCRVCKSEFYLTTGLRCNACPSQCVKCDSSTKCIDCKGRFYKTADDECAACGSNCAECTGSSACTKCDGTYFLKNGLCLSCANCNSTCGAGIACTACDTDYFLQSDGTCADCPYNELDSTSIYCTSCSPSSNLVRVYDGGICDYCPPDCTACSNPTTCTSCATKFYMFNATVCLPCDSSCSTCGGATVNDCATCPTGKFLTVVANSRGKCSAVCNSTCATCSSATACLTCPDGRYLDGTECKSCPTGGLDTYTNLQCTTCAGPYVYQEPCQACTPNCKCCGADLKCLDGQCASGYYLSTSKTCEACTGACTECSGSATACTACASGFEVVSDACVAVCAGDEYRATGGTCMSCNTTVGASCIGCTSDKVCTTCVSGERLLANSSGCQDCSMNNEAACTGGCFWNNTACLPCDSSCKECEDFDMDMTGEADECTSCFAGFRFFNNSCFQSCDASCLTCCGPNADQCVTCRAGRTIEPDGTCAQCTDSANCIDCTGDKEFCNTCSQNKTAVNGQCVDCPSVSSSGAFDADFCNVCLFVSTQSTYGRYRPRTCARCADHCKSCTVPGECTMDMCNTGYVWVSNTKLCRPQDCGNPTTLYECETACANSTAVLKWTGSKCIKCPKNCAACSNSGVCTGCVPNYVRNANDLCVPCFGESAMCTTCGTSTRGRYYVASGKKCYKCIANCLSCTDATSCDTCIPKYYFRSSPPACLPCTSPCTSCKETDSAKECLACIDRYYVNNKTCVACGSNCAECDSTGCTKCDDKFYADGNKTCQACPTGCKTCNSGTTCTTCIDTTNYIKSTNGQCLGCGDANCAKCLNDTYCTTCKTTYYLDRTATPSCKSCGSFCSICNDTVGCTVCDKSHYLDSNKACLACSSALPGCGACTKATECTECFDTPGGSPVYRYLKSDKTCDVCSTGCNNCTSKTTCSSCSSGYCLWDQGSTQSCLQSATPGKNCLTCKQESDGTTVTCLTCASDRALKVCEACTPASGSCKQCSVEKAKCTSCYDGTFKSGDVCAACASGCPTCSDTEKADTCSTCVASTWFDGAAAPKQCKACGDGCGVCTTGTTCTTCAAYRYDPKPGNAVSNKCFYCKPGCYNCTATGCTNCMPGYRLQQTPNVCKRCAVDECDNCNTDIDKCDDCERGYYKKSATECAKCGSKCYRCDDTTGTCTECDAGYYLDRQKVCTLCTESGCGKCGLPPPACTTCNSSYTQENDGCTKRCYVCADCKTPTSSQAVTCAADKVCRTIYTKTSAGVETYQRSCDTKTATETCATTLPAATRTCGDIENVCCTGPLCNSFNCDTKAGAAEMKSCLFLLLSSYLLSLLARRIW